MHGQRVAGSYLAHDEANGGVKARQGVADLDRRFQTQAAVHRLIVEMAPVGHEQGSFVDESPRQGRRRVEDRQAENDNRRNPPPRGLLRVEYHQRRHHKP